MTEHASTRACEQARARPSARPPQSRHFDRLTISLLAAAAFLLLLAFLAAQLQGRGASASSTASRPVLIRRIYQTTVVERVAFGTPSGGSTVTQSSSQPAYTAPAPTPASTRTS